VLGQPQGLDAGGGGGVEGAAARGGGEKAEGGFHFAACLAFREQLLDGARVMQLVAGNGLLKQPHNVRYQH
jgi:hypothetical protein